MNRPAIIFFDIDGTLLDFGKKDLSPKTREALLKLRANGIRICIATGRSPLAVPKFEGVEFDAYLTYNGCYCYEGSKTIYSNPMSLEDVQTIIQNAASMERALSVATKDRLISNGTDPDLEEYYAFGNQKVTISDEFDEVSRGEVYQLLMACRKEEYAQVLQNTQEAKITSWWVARWISSRQAEEKEPAFRRCWSIMALTGHRPWLLGMETTTLKCSRR